AMLLPDQPADLIGIALQQFLEAEHDLGALEWWGVAPGRISGLGSGNSGFDGGFARQRQLFRHLARRRVENVLGAAGLRIDGAVDQVSDRLHRLFSLPVLLAVSVKFVDGVANGIDDIVDLFTLDDERHAQLDGVAAVAYIEAFFPALHGNLDGAPRWLPGVVSYLQRASHPVITDIRDVAGAFATMQGIFKDRAHLPHPINQPVTLQDIQ